MDAMGTQAQIVTSGKMFVQEFVRHGLFPQGFVAEFERVWILAGKRLGICRRDHSAEAWTIAKAFARIGDTVSSNTARL